MRFSCFVFVCHNTLKMAHQLAPSVNCSLDDIDLSALKVSFYKTIRGTPFDQVTREPAFQTYHVWNCQIDRAMISQGVIHSEGSLKRSLLAFMFVRYYNNFFIPGSGWHIWTHRSSRKWHLWPGVQGMLLITFFVYFLVCLNGIIEKIKIWHFNVFLMFPKITL